jgi:hypothetical protein
MERIQVLITKLKDQFEHNADAAQMLMTVQLLQTELSQKQSTGKQFLGTSKVAVVMPKAASAPAPVPVYSSPEFDRYGPKTAVAEVAIVSEPELVGEQKTEKYPAYKNGTNGRKKESSNMLFDPLVEIPTLSHQKGVKEINETVSDKQESLNDKLRKQHSDLGDMLKGTPIKDLRKAIGINDRFVFISELFRGDEPMYERSIKTINGFNIFAEAEYWINRELIVKLGWASDSDTVVHFYQLVKRRFS